MDANELLSTLRENPHNPRTITPDDFEKLKFKIRNFPQMLEKRPIAYDSSDNYITLGGNRRLNALQDLVKEGFTIKPEYFTDCAGWTPEQKRTFVILDNVSDGDWNYELLANEWSDLPLEEWGLDPAEWEKKKEVTEDEPPAVNETEPAVSQLGEVYQLGRHRLMCGDATKIEDVEKLLNGQKADMGFNDPPYGMRKENEGVLNDNLNYADLLKFNREWISLQFTQLKDNGSFYCWGTDEPLMDIYSEIIKPYIKTQKATFRNLITWNKGNGQGQNSEEYRMYAIADEKCLFVMCGVQGFNTNADNYFEGWEPVRDYLLKSREAMGWDIPTMKRIAGHSDLSGDHWTSKSQFNFPTREVYEKLQAEADRVRAETNNDAFKKEYDELKKEYDELKKEYDELKKEYYSTRAYFDNTHENMNNVWHIGRDVTNLDHATPKPVELCARAIKSSCPENGIAMDWFGGSGSTLIACEQTSRTCYMMELDTKYCDVIRKRYAKFIGRENDWKEIK